jgi:hypothetical protein
VAPAPGRDAIPKRRLLSGRSTAESLQKSLTDSAHWKPYPAAAEREAWNALAADAKDRVMKEGAALLGKAYEPLPSTLFLEYARTGNRTAGRTCSSGAACICAAPCWPSARSPAGRPAAVDG